MGAYHADSIKYPHTLYLQKAASGSFLPKDYIAENCGEPVAEADAIATCNCSDSNEYCDSDYLEFLMCPNAVWAGKTIDHCHTCPSGSYCRFKHAKPQNCTDYGFTCKEGGTFCDNGTYPSLDEWKCSDAVFRL